ncbi:MAG: hypothetical protein D3918_10430, partial [Candidatus Electrothrix sp. AX2]|nr:hypothetical protein [Candidatus Electrothrix gigas]
DYFLFLFQRNYSNRKISRYAPDNRKNRTFNRTLINDKTLQTQARANTLDTFKFPFEELFMNKLIERMEQNQGIFERIMEDKDDFGSVVMALMMQNVYERLNA